MREHTGGNKKGHTPVFKPETVEKRKLRSLEAQIEKLNNDREIRLFKLRFEPIFERTDISRQAKWQKAHRIAREKGIEVAFKVTK